MLYKSKIALKFFRRCAEAITSPPCGKKLYQAMRAFDKRNSCLAGEFCISPLIDIARGSKTAEAIYVSLIGINSRLPRGVYPGRSEGAR